jgi:hypothetical protein
MRGYRRSLRWVLQIVIVLNGLTVTLLLLLLWRTNPNFIGLIGWFPPVLSLPLLCNCWCPKLELRKICRAIGSRFTLTNHCCCRVYGTNNGNFGLLSRWTVTQVLNCWYLWASLPPTILFI